VIGAGGLVGLTGSVDVVGRRGSAFASAGALAARSAAAALGPAGGAWTFAAARARLGGSVDVSRRRDTLTWSLGYRRRAVPAGEPLERGVELAVDERDELGIDRVADGLGENLAAGGDELGDLLLELGVDVGRHDRPILTLSRRCRKRRRRATFMPQTSADARFATRLRDSSRGAQPLSPCGFERL
jgi:hypothetical protein